MKQNQMKANWKVDLDEWIETGEKMKKHNGFQILCKIRQYFAANLTIILADYIHLGIH